MFKFKFKLLFGIIQLMVVDLGFFFGGGHFYIITYHHIVLLTQYLGFDVRSSKYSITVKGGPRALTLNPPLIISFTTLMYSRFW